MWYDHIERRVIHREVPAPIPNSVQIEFCRKGEQSERRDECRDHPKWQN